LAVVCVEGLDLESGTVGLREQSDATVCHRTVHVHKKEFDLGSALLKGRRDFHKARQRNLQETNQEKVQIKAQRMVGAFQRNAVTEIRNPVGSHNPTRVTFPRANELARQLASVGSTTHDNIAPPCLGLLVPRFSWADTG